LVTTTESEKPMTKKKRAARSLDARPKDPTTGPPEKPVTEEGLTIDGDELGKQSLNDATEQGNFESSPNDPSGPIESELTVFEPGGFVDEDELQASDDEAGEEGEEEASREGSTLEDARTRQAPAHRRAP
jgi:hypothetical protein